MHRARCVRFWPCHDPVAQVALERDRTAVKASVGVCDIQWRGLKLRLRFGFHTGGVAPLDLTASIGQFFSEHSVTTRPTVMKRIGLAHGVGGASTGDNQTGEMLVPSAACAIFAVAHAG